MIFGGVSMQHILIVEDDLDIQELLKNFLQEVGYAVTLASDGIEAISLFASTHFDLILLDIMLPKIDGFTVCELIRKQSRVPIIMLTALNGEEEQIRGLDLQVDDYITKPFNIQILLAKIGALLRRTNMQGETNDKIDVKDFILNTSNNTIEKDGKVIELTKNEYKILKYLVQNRGKIVSREDIMECLWESESFIDDNTLTVNITRLRNKLEELELKELLETKRGQGFFLKKGVN